MNVDTLSLVQRSYADLVDDLLTAIVGGVVNEPIPFDIKQLRYALSQPATAVRSIKGTIVGPDGLPLPEVHVFQANIDYVFSASDASVVWQPKSTNPLDETTFYVDYFRPNTQSPLSDINVGGVTRTLTEAIGREIATVYREIYNAYLSGFVDTAQGQSLDYVVSILGVARLGAEYATGLATFLRDPASSGNVTIPDGTQVATAKRIVFETTELRTLQQGQQRLDVPIRATATAKGPAGVVAAGSIVALEVPIAGIASVTNFDATVLGTAPESDVELRARAKATLQGLGMATLAALARAVFDERSTLQEVRDPNGAPGKTSAPGTVLLLVSTQPARYGSVNARIQETRAAGVLATVVARYVFVTPRMALTLTAPLTPAGKLKLVGQLIDALQAYADTLQAGDPADAQKMLEAINKIPEIKSAKPHFLDVITAKADINDPGAQPLVEALVAAVQAVPPGDAAALATAIKTALTSDVAPLFGESRTADRSLVVGKSGPATDAEIEAGAFQIVPPSDGNNKWSIALDMQRSDVQMAGG
ncbi:Baseplate J-like protein [Rhizobiales bacterium GAS191]|nr:Baseplate J-like protein [Rhizobiales bacterium GAS191]